MGSAAKQVGCSARAVRRWWERFCSTKAVDDKPRRGRPPVLSNKIAKKALGMLCNRASCSGSADVAKQLASTGITGKLLHKTTVMRAAKRVACLQGKKLIARRGKPKKGLTELQRQKRLAFAVASMDMEWSNVMFSDMKRFYFRYPGSKVNHDVRWVLEGNEDQSVFQPSSPSCFNIYAAITKHGVTHVHVVSRTKQHKEQHLTKRGQLARNITQAEYTSVVKKTLLPAGHNVFSRQGIPRWVLQQDGDKSHGVAMHLAKAWSKHKCPSVSILPNWPPNSPDLNIMENVWAWTQKRVDKLGCRSFDEFKQTVVDALAAVPQHVVDNLFDNLKQRMAIVIEKRGGYT